MDWMHPDDREWLEAHEEQEERRHEHDQMLAARDRLEEKAPVERAVVFRDGHVLTADLNAAMLDVFRIEPDWNDVTDKWEAVYVLMGGHGHLLSAGRERLSFLFSPRMVIADGVALEVRDEIHVWPDLERTSAIAARSAAAWWRRWFGRS